MSVKAEILMLKGIISEMPEEDQKKINAIREQLDEIVTKNEPLGFISLALLGLEKSIEHGIE